MLAHARQQKARVNARVVLAMVARDVITPEEASANLWHQHLRRLDHPIYVVGCHKDKCTRMGTQEGPYERQEPVKGHDALLLVCAAQM